MNDATILVVDDDPQIRDVLKVALERASFRVNLARDGIEGLRETQVGEPDLAILDIGMPEMDGLELCRAIRRESEAMTM
jgi:two-component system OmpR family response regulator